MKSEERKERKERKEFPETRNPSNLPFFASQKSAIGAAQLSHTPPLILCVPRTKQHTIVCT